MFTVPVYDYVLMTEPLTRDQWESIGWTERHGITDSSREFHYYRKTKDDRILFGGYDAIYHRGRKVKASQDQRPAAFERLADHFFITFHSSPVSDSLTRGWRDRHVDTARRVP